jgi:hypothetical protein
MTRIIPLNDRGLSIAGGNKCRVPLKMWSPQISRLFIWMLGLGKPSFPELGLQVSATLDGNCLHAGSSAEFFPLVMG